jgi:hypothetical protein
MRLCLREGWPQRDVSQSAANFCFSVLNSPSVAGIGLSQFSKRGDCHATLDRLRHGSDEGVEGRNARGFFQRSP